MVNPHWPHLPKRKDKYDTNEEEDGIEGAWRTIPDDPLDYHFYYHILDGDKAGRPPKLLASEGNKQVDNEYFDRRDKSCLHLIAKSRNKVRDMSSKDVNPYRNSVYFKYTSSILCMYLQEKKYN